jgi:hypothetical protein
MAKLWSLRGLSWRELAKRTCRKSWDDEIFGQSASGSEWRGALLDSFKTGSSSGCIVAHYANHTANKRESRLRYGSLTGSRVCGLGSAERDLGHDNRSEEGI